MRQRTDSSLHYRPEDHTFVVCAYGESPYLEALLKSLLRQKVRTRIVISTSTPNDHIKHLARKYNLPLYIRMNEERGIAADWNGALGCADSALVTLAHQDDLYAAAYTESILRAANRSEGHGDRPVIVFTDYVERRDEAYETSSTLLRIKRLLLLPLRHRALQEKRLAKRAAICLGNPICCPSVTYVKGRIEEPLFASGLQSNMDWLAWEDLSRKEGAFVYIPRALTAHRIHASSTTSKVLEENSRAAEDLLVFRKFWPEPIARALSKVYRKSEASNALD